MDALNVPLFIAGTDTGVGKTTVACGIAASLRLLGIDVGVMKPVETGHVPGSRRSDAARLRRFAASEDAPGDIAPFVYRDPVAPWIAARNVRHPIRVDRIVRKARMLISRHEVVLIEGIGGLLVPLTRRLTVLDLITPLRAAVLLVASDRVGTLNHTLLSVRAGRAAGVDLIGIIVNSSGMPVPRLARGSTLKVMEELTGVHVWGQLPRMKVGALSQPTKLAQKVSRILPPERLIRFLKRGRESRDPAKLR